VVRLTARTSLALFLAAFLASALRRRWPRPATAWLRQNRRYVGLGFAVSHLLHLLAILALGRWFPSALGAVPWPTLVVGGGGFVVVALLAATSSDAAVRWLGSRRWNGLHRAGVYYLWAVFTVTYASHGFVLPALLVGALVLRLRG
jgi:DMSO/TMAO reductase YedYZ heme-binding membrane subunit